MSNTWANPLFGSPGSITRRFELLTLLITFEFIAGASLKLICDLVLPSLSWPNRGNVENDSKMIKTNILDFMDAKQNLKLRVI
jgi:hypothetical protein